MRRVTPNVMSLEPDGESPAAGIEDVAWIAGSWRAESLGGVAEEVWSPPGGGTMMGMFRLIKDGRLTFYELLSMSELGRSLILRLKHFNADLTGWEGKDEAVVFPLVKLGENEAFFDGMTFRAADDELHVFVLSSGKDGGANELSFRYARAETP